MKTTKEDILFSSLKLFAERGFDAVSTSMIASELGITKGALYRHYENKQAIFDGIVARMLESDEQQTDDDDVRISEDEDDDLDLCEFVCEQYAFWTENEFSRLFRRMITIEQYKSKEMGKLYRDVIALGPINYTADMLGQMIENGSMNDRAAEFGAWNLAIELCAPLQLSIQLFDGGKSSRKVKEDLRKITEDFEKRWLKKEE